MFLAAAGSEVFPGCCCEAALVYSDTKELRLLGKMWFRNSVSSEDLDVCMHMESIPANGDLIMLPRGTLLHFLLFSHRVIEIEILAPARTKDSQGNLQFAGTKGGR